MWNRVLKTCLAAAAVIIAVNTESQGAYAKEKFSFNFEKALSHFREITFTQLNEMRGFVGHKSFLPIGWLRASQFRASYARAESKLLEDIYKYGAHWSEKRNRWVVKNDDGHSLQPLEEAVPAVLLKDGIYLIDGHHDAIGSIALGVESFPVNIIADLSYIPVSQAWTEMINRKWVYPKRLSGEKTNDLRPHFNSLENDPNRHLVSLISRQIHIKSSGSWTSKGSEHPVWLKINKGRPFMEFALADLLYSYGIVYDEDWGDEVPKKVVEKIREIFVKEQQKDNPALRGVVVVEKRRWFSDIKPEKLIRSSPSCVELLLIR